MSSTITSEVEGNAQDALSVPRAPQRAETMQVGHEDLTDGRPNGRIARRRILGALNHLTGVLDKKNTYAYKNIDCDNEIRILNVYPGAPGTPILCCLVSCPLYDQSSVCNTRTSTKYTALSYTWGEDLAEHEIYIFDCHESYQLWKEKDKTNSLLPFVGRMLVGKNLKEALEQLRSSTDVTLPIWVDALSINQSSIREKTIQVARMHDVYSQASNVCIWLGVGQRTEDYKAFELLRRILNLQALEELVARLDKRDDDGVWKQDRRDCKRVIDLMNSEWFGRRWIIQELALAMSAYVRRGVEEMPWSEFADAIALFMTKYEHIQRSFHEPTDYAKSLTTDDYQINALDARALGANILVTATTNLFRKSNDGRILQRLLSLEFLVSSMLIAFEAKDPRDTIFAVLKLAKDTSTTDLATKSDTTRLSIFKGYLAPLSLAVLWVFGIHTGLLFGGNSDTSTELSLRETALALHSGSKVIILIECFNRLIVVVVFWLVWHLVLNSLPKLYSQFIPGLAKIEKMDKRIEPNYQKCLGDVCADFIEYCIETSGSLDILCRHWAPHSKLVEMPSWILPITGDAFGGPKQSKKGRVYGDSFVGGSERRGQQGHYTASGSTLPAFRFGKTGAVQEIAMKEQNKIPGEYAKANLEDKRELPPQFDGTLTVRGFQVGTIDQTAPVAGPVISRAALELCGWEKGVGPRPDVDQDQIWRILVANRGPNGSNPPSWYRRACTACLEWYDLQAEDTYNTRELKNMPGTPSGKVDFLDRVQRVVYNRNIIQTCPIPGYPKGFVGIAPQKAQKSDIVCILFGCSVPVVLQPQKNGEYKFIGECYVHGVMDGELVDKSQVRGRKEWFVLR